jgi:hypothetical protein
MAPDWFGKQLLQRCVGRCPTHPKMYFPNVRIINMRHASWGQDVFDLLGSSSIDLPAHLCQHEIMPLFPLWQPATAKPCLSLVTCIQGTSRVYTLTMRNQHESDNISPDQASPTCPLPLRCPDIPPTSPRLHDRRQRDTSTISHT